MLRLSAARRALVPCRHLCDGWRRGLSTEGSTDSTAAPAAASSLADRARSLVFGDKARQKATAKALSQRASGKGWMEATTDAMSTLRKERQNDHYSDHLAQLLDIPEVTFDQVRTQIEQIASSKDKMTFLQRTQLRFDAARGGGQSEAIEGMIKEYTLQLNVIDAMTPSERHKPLMLVKRPAIQRIMRELGLADDTAVRNVLRMYRGMLVQHELIHREAKAGRPLPTSQAEVDTLVKLYPTRSSVAFVKAEHWKQLKQQRRGKGRR